MRYCGSKYFHEPHEWRQIGRPAGPLFQCPGKARPEPEPEPEPNAYGEV